MGISYAVDQPYMNAVMPHIADAGNVSNQKSNKWLEDTGALLNGCNYTAKE